MTPRPRLRREHIIQIVDLQMREIEERLHEQGMRILITPAAKGWLADKGYDESFGARPLRRALQRYVESPLSQRLLAGEFAPGDVVHIDLNEGGDGLTFTRAERAESLASLGQLSGVE